jgi:glucose-6-phosphate isomerase
MTVTAPLDERARRVCAELAAEGFASRMLSGDPTLWGAAAESEAAIRLGWTDPGPALDETIAQAAALFAELDAEGRTSVVLCGMGGSSLAPEVICAAAGRPLVTLDSSDPDQVRAALDTDLSKVTVVVSSKSGSTIETASQRAAFEKAFTDAGLDPARHLVVVTDPGSPLEKSAADAGYRVFTADPHVGGRFSALTAFGMVPSILAGVDVTSLVADARRALTELAANTVENPALVLGSAVAADPGRNKLLVSVGDGLANLPDWVEQLVAESTGKNGHGVLPVIGHPRLPDVSFPDAVRVGLTDGTGTAPGEVTVSGSLGTQFVLWEAATAVVGRILGVNPFDQPDVESAKVAARSALDESGAPPEPVLRLDGMDVYGDPGLVGDAGDLDAALAALLGRLGPTSYLAVMAYVQRTDDSPLPAAVTDLISRCGRPVTFGWGPRFLHSTGQLHKGGAPEGVFLQITGQPDGDDLAIPGTEISFGRLIQAQASGDGAVLRDHGLPVMRIHLHDRTAGVAELIEAFGRV